MQLKAILWVFATLFHHADCVYKRTDVYLVYADNVCVCVYVFATYMHVTYSDMHKWWRDECVCEL